MERLKRRVVFFLWYRSNEELNTPPSHHCRTFFKQFSWYNQRYLVSFCRFASLTLSIPSGIQERRNLFLLVLLVPCNFPRPRAGLFMVVSDPFNSVHFSYLWLNRTISLTSMFVELIANIHQTDYTNTLQLMSCLQTNVFENTQFIFSPQGYVAGCLIHMSSFLTVKLKLSKQGNDAESISVTEQITMPLYDELPD